MSSVRIVFLADTHLGFDYPVKPRIQRRRRGPDFFDNFHNVLDFARQTRPDLVLHGGDLFFRARIPQKIIDLVYDDLFEFAQEGIPILIVPGNHERSILPVSLFLNHPNIYIFDRPLTYSFSLDGGAVNLSGFPCQRKKVRDQFSALISETGWHELRQGAKLLCLHQTVEGSQVGPSNYTFRRGVDVIPQSALPKDATAVLSGHIHRRQVLGNLSIGEGELPPVIYPGSIERTSFAEREEEKGFFEIELITDAEGIWRVDRLDFHHLPARPMVDIFIDNSVVGDDLRSHIKRQAAPLPVDSIVRFRCSPELDPWVREKVTSSLLREILPESMNYQFSADFHRKD